MSIKKCCKFDYNCPYYDDETSYCLDIKDSYICHNKIDWNKQLNVEEITVGLVQHLKRIERQNSDLLKLVRQQQK